MGRSIPVGRVVCVTVADLAAIVLAERVIPRAAWWLPLLTIGGGLPVLVATFALMWWLVRREDRGWWPRRCPAEIPAAPQRVLTGYVLRVESAWPRSQWPRQIAARTALPAATAEEVNHALFHQAEGSR